MSSMKSIEMMTATAVVTAPVLVVFFGTRGAVSIFFASIAWWVVSNTCLPWAHKQARPEGHTAQEIIETLHPQARPAGQTDAGAAFVAALWLGREPLGPNGGQNAA